MAVQLPTYCTREEVKRALDIQATAYNDAQVDRAIEAAREDVGGLCQRRFYNVIETQYWDWPNYQRAYPWRIWFDARELADTTVNVPVVTSGGTLIPSSAIFWGPWNYSPPFTYLELDRSQNYSFGLGSTPQKDVAITGTFGYWDQQVAAGVLAVAMGDTTTGTAVVSNSAAVGVGDVLICGSERMLVQDRAMYDTGQAQQGSGCETALTSDNLLGVTTGADYFPQEVLQLDAEQMLVLSVTGNNLLVKRAYNGTAISAHSGAEIYAPRSLTVTRGGFGSTAATHTQSTATAIQLIPSLAKELSVAEAVNHVLQETEGYARAMPAGTGGVVPGGSLPDIRERCFTVLARKARRRVI